jgi:hypothetical protein
MSNGGLSCSRLGVHLYRGNNGKQATVAHTFMTIDDPSSESNNGIAVKYSVPCYVCWWADRAIGRRSRCIILGLSTTDAQKGSTRGATTGATGKGCRSEARKAANLPVIKLTKLSSFMCLTDSSIAHRLPASRRRQPSRIPARLCQHLLTTCSPATAIISYTSTPPFLLPMYLTPYTSKAQQLSTCQFGKR